MPELPEVETIKNLLNSQLVGKTISTIDVLKVGSCWSDVKEFKEQLKLCSINSITRIGKCLIFHLSNENVIISHLRMEGKFYEFKENEPNSEYARVVFHFTDNTKLCFDDSRCFGYVKLAKESNYMLDSEVSKIADEPFNISLDSLYEKVKDISGNIKETITNQSIISGIGNIYADEILYDCKINPKTATSSISKTEWECILNSSKRILKEAISSGGSTIKSYHPGKNISGNFQVNLKAYGKEGEKCPRCGSTFKFIKVNGRGTTYCPNCQMKKGKKILVALYGKVASGKSTVLSIFKDKGYKTFSADEVVKSLYKRKEVVQLFNKQFGFSFLDEVKKEDLRSYINNNPSSINEINNIVHPLVIEETKRFIRKEKQGIIVFEIPLLYESKMEYLFDYTIAIDVNKSIQEERISKRNSLTSEFLLKLNNSNTKFEKNKIKADAIIDNSSGLNELNIQVEKIINKLKDCLD